jgi:phenylacetic acid degradation operon negative regulatory protein
VALARLLEAGRVARDERGRYSLGAGALPIGRRVRGWRDLAGRVRAWRGGWIGVLCGPTERRRQRRRRDALRLLGFQALERALWLRPDNLAPSLDDLRGELALLGLPAGDLLCRLADLDVASERRARGLWDVAAIRRGHRASLRRLETSAARLARLPEREAMVESFLIGGEVLRTLVLDPLLPESICPTADRDQLLGRMRDYDRAGRLAWARLLERHDVPCLRAPVDAHARPAALAG